MSQIKSLKEFIGKAEKLGKYARNTANGILTAITKAENGLTEEEPNDLEYFKEHLQELYGRQEGLNLSIDSVAIYMSRIRNAIKDYQKYGTQPGAIYSWQTKTKPLVKKTKKEEPEEKEEENTSTNNGGFQPKNDSFSGLTTAVKLNIVSWRLRPGVVIRIELPEDLNDNDVKKIKALLDIETQFKD
jgi:hypothetical protein